MRRLLDRARRALTPRSRRAPDPQRGAPAGTEPARPAYRGDYRGLPPMNYAPKPDGRPDPGEIVWAWVPFEEDPSQGKDRPVLLIGRDGADLLGLYLTSKDHERDAAQERRAGRLWLDLGSGDWDVRRRPSEVRINRVLRIDETTVRREGAVLDAARFEQVTIAVRAAYQTS
ncbi:type II toxin-antitoxin system PemK/MazF family toxin [Calidifontibacter sp. DB0510]|uniref:Type II toxin-antitoxin system PemK/MazF family toxin n=1 Tax=Metallococcus carri TaxID=1656884 RepID=A0A967AWX5_9MICO|nr:type II toxin-antitoxin system PemK/MazF family toxin [Metallococcus carri]NHN54218.1 type II toxin-antitoxin system PemK/MazF family toxin [Metallococcus carri]NOP36942.1 type II toxin-antitoxin system PemK/MazF family toxin [Calidifontibacter sp. DB2511S]